MYGEYGVITGVSITSEMDIAIEKAVENRQYRSKSDLIREGIDRILTELKAKEQQTNTQTQGQSKGAVA